MNFGRAAVTLPYIGYLLGSEQQAQPSAMSLWYGLRSPSDVAQRQMHAA